MEINTTQDIYDYIKGHLLAQRVQSLGPHTRDASGVSEVPRYRYGSLSCAVGCLIADEHYSADLENMIATEAPVMEAVSASTGRELDDQDAELLRRMQCVHDYYQPKEWPQKMARVASDMRLSG